MTTLSRGVSVVALAAGLAGFAQAADAAWWNPFKPAQPQPAPIQVAPPPVQQPGVQAGQAPLPPAAATGYMGPSQQVPTPGVPPTFGPPPPAATAGQPQQIFAPGQPQASYPPPQTGPAQPLQPATARPDSAEVDAVTRLQRSEAQVRTLTGQVEELTYQVKQLQEQLRRAQEAADGRSSAAPTAQAGTGQAAAPQAPGRNSLRGSNAPPPDAPMEATTGAAMSDTIIGPPRPEPGAPGETSATRIDATPGRGDPPRVLGQVPATAPSALPPGNGPINLSALGNRPADQGAQRLGQPGSGAVASLGTAPVAAASPREAYDRAYERILAGDYEVAEASLKQFLATYPGDKLAPDAQYWLGESYFQRAMYKEAAESFLDGYTGNPKSGKAPDTLLKLGMSLKGLGQKKEACATFSEVLKKYTTASNALIQRVKAEQAGAGC